MNEQIMTAAKNIKEKNRKRQIEHLRTYYNRLIVDSAVSYADFDIAQRPSASSLLDMAKEKAIEVGQEEVADLIDMQVELDAQLAFNNLTSAYMQGVSFMIANPDISKTPKPVTDYVLSKDFAFIFDYGDNDFSTFMCNAAKEYCKEYNKLLRNIELYSSIRDEYTDETIESYKKNIEFMENPDNVRQLIKAAFIGEYMKKSIDRCWIGADKEFNAMTRLNHAQDLANVHFNFETNEAKNNEGRVDWKFGTWDEISKFGLEHYKGMQGEDDIKRANGDLTKYWLNGEVLIVRMVDGYLVAETY